MSIRNFIIETTMKKLIVLFLLFVSTLLSAQVVTTVPALPQSTDAITIHFNAEEGTGGLADYTGDIYAHIGLITEKSTSGTDWKYTKAEWNENRPDCKLTRVSANEYTLQISPNPHTFFACPTDEKILQLAMVFRSSTGSPEGKGSGGTDIYTEIYEEGLNISFGRTVSYVLEESGADIAFTANSSTDANLEIFVDGVSKKSETSTKTIEYSQAFPTGDYQVIATATTGGQTVSDTISVCALGTPTSATQPSGTKDGINYSGTSVTFVLHAPNKENVLLMGDFNNWVPSNDYLMKKDGERWWLTVENLTLGEEYAFQYFVDREISIADPYSEKVLDPWNDSYIPESVYPNLKPYPKDKTLGIVGVVSPGADEYEWDVEDFTPPTNEKLVIYELLVRDFVDSHDIKDVVKKLDYLDELGITAVELMPVNEFEGNSSWGYNPSYYFAFDKYYGRKNDLKMFVDSCHARGIAVIMDLTLNHAFYQCPLVTLYFDEANDRPSAENPWFNQTSPNTEYFWGADFNHESEHTQAFVDRVAEYWLTEYKVDGFRYDFTKGFTNTSGGGWNYDKSRIDILKRIYDEQKKVNADSYMILEHFCADSEEKELANYGMMIWGNMNHQYNQCTMGYEDNSSILRVSHKNRGWDYPNLVGYMESHDEERLMYKNNEYGNSDGSYNIKETSTALDRNELGAVFFLTVPGPKMIWQFGELGYDYSIDYNDRVGEKPIHWDYYEDPDRRDLYDVYAKLNKLRAEYDVFTSSDFNITEFNDFTKRINIYHDSSDVAIIGNFDVQTQWAQPNFSSTGKWYEFFADDSINVSNTDMEIELQPGEYKLYSTIRMAAEVDDIDLPNTEIKFQTLNVFPNPSSELINIHSNANIYQIRLISLTGQIVKQNQVNGSEVQINVSDIPAGTYIMQVYGDGFSDVTKVMIR